MDKKYTKYADEVLNNKIITNEYVKLACKRFYRFLGRDDMIFKPKKVDKVVDFISKLKHFTGKSNGKRFILSDWQYFIIENIFGFYWKNTGKRVTKNVYIEVARKAGKSALISAIALYCLIADGENGSEVDCIANTRQQAKILFDMGKNFAKTIDGKQKYIKSFRDKITFDATCSYMQVLSSDAATLDGFNSYLFVQDELHAAPDSRLYDVLKSSQGMRENPLAICITSAGFNKFGFCYHMRETCTEILHEKKEDDSQFSIIYSIDEGDDWQNPEVWVKANPNLGITVTKDYLEEQVVQAKNNPSLEVGVRTKNFGEWVSTSDIWINNDILLKNTVDVDLNKFEGLIGYVGIDLASVSDLTAVSLMIPKDDKYYFKSWYYLPQSALSDNSNAELYKDWKRKGLITITAGNVTDYDYILSDLLKINRKVMIEKIAYDAYNATQFAINATAEGLPLEPFSQALWNFNKPSKELERLIKSNSVKIDNNEITRYCFGNVVLKIDHNDNIKPTKLEKQQKIDGTISMIEALGIFLDTPRYNNQILAV